MNTTQEKVAPHTWTDGGDKVLLLRRISKDGTSYGGFAQWGKPDELNIVVKPEKWDEKPKCGDGIHGWPWGMGLGEGSDYSIIDDRWLVVAAKPEDVVGELGGGLKCKAREVVKIYDGVFAGAWALINGGRHRLIEAMSKDSAIKDIAAGDGSKSASSGNYSKSASSGDGSTSASSGNYSKSASSGDGSTSAQQGTNGIAAAIGHNTKAKAGELGMLIVCRWFESEKRYRAAIGYVGENGVKADTWYELNERMELVECK